MCEGRGGSGGVEKDRDRGGMEVGREGDRITEGGRKEGEE